MEKSIQVVVVAADPLFPGPLHYCPSHFSSLEMILSDFSCHPFLHILLFCFPFLHILLFCSPSLHIPEVLHPFSTVLIQFFFSHFSTFIAFLLSIFYTIRFSSIPYLHFLLFFSLFSTQSVFLLSLIYTSCFSSLSFLHIPLFFSLFSTYPAFRLSFLHIPIFFSLFSTYPASLLSLFLDIPLFFSAFLSYFFPLKTCNVYKFCSVYKTLPTCTYLIQKCLRFSLKMTQFLLGMPSVWATSGGFHISVSAMEEVKPSRQTKPMKFSKEKG